MMYVAAPLRSETILDIYGVTDLDGSQPNCWSRFRPRASRPTDRLPLAGHALHQRTHARPLDPPRREARPRQQLAQLVAGALAAVDALGQHLDVRQRRERVRLVALLDLLDHHEPLARAHRTAHA